MNIKKNDDSYENIDTMKHNFALINKSLNDNTYIDSNNETQKKDAFINHNCNTNPFPINVKTVINDINEELINDRNMGSTKPYGTNTDGLNTDSLNTDSLNTDSLNTDDNINLNNRKDKDRLNINYEIVKKRKIAQESEDSNNTCSNVENNSERSLYVVNKNSDKVKEKDVNIEHINSVGFELSETKFHVSKEEMLNPRNIPDNSPSNSNNEIDGEKVNYLQIKLEQLLSETKKYT
ncbi:conserved protein, unknown function, partial [Hepatocystis sp. ex Piliocolobus tephrosceles]